MASYARSICFFSLLVLSFSLQTQARDSKFFNKLSRGLTKNTDENKQSISVSPTQSPSLAPTPAPESVVVEHGYGLYGDERYQYPPTTTDPVRSAGLREDKFVSLDEIRKNYYKGNGNGNGNGNGYVGEKQGMTDTRFMENGKYDYDVNQDVKDENAYKGNGIGNGDGYVSEKQGMSEYVEDEDSHPENEELRIGKGNENVNKKQGMSDTRFLENGKYYHDINKDVNDRSSYFENQGNGNGNGNGKGNGNRNEFVNEKQEISDNRSLDVDDNVKDESYLGNKRSWNGNGNGNGNGYVTKKQGMSDTRFLGNGKYYYDVNQDIKNENSYLDNNRNAYGNGYVTEKQGMSDTRFLENGKYYHDIRNENGNPNNNYNYNNNHENMASLNNKNEYANGYNENDEHYNGNHGYVTEARGRYDYNPSEYVTEGRGGYYGNTKKLPNEYDTMEEYDKEQGYKEIPNEYVP